MKAFNTQHIIQLIHERNTHQIDPFNDIFETYQTLLKQNTEMEQQKQNLENENYRLKNMKKLTASGPKIEKMQANIKELETKMVNNFEETTNLAKKLSSANEELKLLKEKYDDMKE